MSELNQKELEVFTSKARADKAINSLKGILLGINLDEQVNEKEINELKKWAENHRSLINRNPFKEFMTIIDETVSNNIPATETIEDLFWLCQKYENDNYYYNAVTTDLQTLQGICHGILADGIINEKEVRDLEKWLEQNTHLSTYYPYDEIRSLMLSIVSDGIIEEEEILILKAYLNQFVNIENKEIAKQIDQETADINISGHCTSDPNIEFDGKTFCVTGVLKSGNRSELENLISDLGGIPTKTVTKKTDYLIVGDNGNPAWAFACYGRKVEKALEMRKSGHQICLVHEFDFMDAVEDLK
ncbi:BRCT domain-containing protein [Flavobacteriaceae bacterium XHP0103]|uniref:BRCT domain-containing protein n=1 Tax=Marixanthotalea marina TaxID=2844359 RepID=UPI002989F501|nr:BRCT domain-containing protein [Marixanthotalea marina]MBU3822520.1 BRCT domain-containing protein [Marixanthotalea marina]